MSRLIDLLIEGKNKNFLESVSEKMDAKRDEVLQRQKRTDSRNLIVEASFDQQVARIAKNGDGEISFDDGEEAPLSKKSAKDIWSHLEKLSPPQRAKMAARLAKSYDSFMSGLDDLMESREEELEETKKKAVTYSVYAPKEKGHYMQKVHSKHDNLDDAKKAAEKHLADGHPNQHVFVTGDGRNHFVNTKNGKWTSLKEESSDEELDEKKGEEKRNSEDPCQDGYVQVGWKTKDGDRVPNCVPEDEVDESISEEFRAFLNENALLYEARRIGSGQFQKELKGKNSEEKVRAVKNYIKAKQESLDIQKEQDKISDYNSPAFKSLIKKLNAAERRMLNNSSGLGSEEDMKKIAKENGMEWPK